MATAELNPGITLGMRKVSEQCGHCHWVQVQMKDRLSGTSSGASGQANNDITNTIAIGTEFRANH